MADYLTFQNIYEGIRYYIKTKGASKDTLIKDVVNMVYMTEIMVCDDLYPLFWMVDFDDSRASVAPATITGITKADPAVITTSAAHGLVADDIISIHNIVGMTELNNRIYKIASADTTTTMELEDLEGKDEIDSTNFTAWSSGGTIHHRGLTLGTTPTGFQVQRIIGNPKWHDEKIMTPASMAEIERWNSYTNDSTARPNRFLHKKAYAVAGTEYNFLIWFQGADAAYDLRYWYEKRASKLVLTNDIPLLPPQFHNAIIAGAVARLAESNVQVENQVVWPAIYQQQLDAIRTFNRKWWAANEEPELLAPYLL
jgi:hypothetical protein